MKKLLITLLFFVFLNEAHSSHIWGGSVTWECIASGSDKGKFIFITSIYGRCEPDLGGYIPIISNGLYSKWGGPATISVTRSNREHMDTLCVPAFSQLACYTVAGISIMYRFTHKSIPIKLYGVPDIGGTNFWFRVMSRPTVTSNTTASQFYVRANMFPYLNPSNAYDTLGTSQFSTCYDNSPQFAEAPFYIKCRNILSQLNFGSTDVDGDSLVYEWTDPMDNVSQPVVWRTGFSTYNQFPDSNFSKSNIAAVLNQKTGVVSFKIDTPSYFLSTAIKATSYRNGQKIAEIFRDCHVLIAQCQYSTPVTDPSITYKLPSSSIFQPSISLTKQIGDSIELDIRSIDKGILSINPVVLQSPDLQVFGTSVSTVPNNSTKCQVSPCAYLDSVGNASWNGNKFRKVTDVTVRFKWVPSCDQLKNANGPRTFTFYVKSQDDHCMLPGVGYSTFEITLIDTVSADTKLKQLNIVDNSIFLQWNSVSSSSFQSYNIFGSANASGPWTNIHTNSNINATDYTDIPSGSVKTPIYYKIFSNTGMFCSNENIVYRAVIMNKSVKKSRVYLNWNMPFVDTLNFRYGRYYIERKDSNAMWYTLDSINNLTHSYVDNNPGHGYKSFYRIKADNKQGFTALSNIDSIYFPLPPPMPNSPLHNGSIDTSHVGIINHDQDTWRIYPNPFNQYVLIEANDVKESTELKAFDVKGNIVFSRNIVDGRNVVDTRSLSKGLYYFTYRNSNNEVLSQRVVKVE